MLRKINKYHFVMKKRVVLYALIIVSSVLTIGKAEDKLPSLCDEWNVLDSYYYGQGFPYFTSEYKFKNDTIIGAYTYKQLRKDGGGGKVTDEYVGALREDNNANIYYVPADSEHEFLLYAFNAQPEDTFTNLWVGGTYQMFPDGHKAVVKEIRDETPKTFVIEAYKNGDENSWKYIYTWIEGIGSQYGVTGDPCPFDCTGGGAHNLLCAYKNGQKIYESEYVEQFGCVFNGDIPSANKWYGIEYANYPSQQGGQGSEINGLTYELTGDTTISGFHFRKLYVTRKEGTRTYQGAVRYDILEVGRPMYYVPEDYIPEDDVFGGFPLQRFDVKAGDIVQAYGGMNTMPCVGDATISYTVTDVRYIDARKHVYVKATGYNGQELKLEWIEGIGTPYIIWSGERSCQPTDGSTVIQYTLCAADSEGNILYSFDTDYLGIHNDCPNWEPMDVGNIQAEPVSAAKVLRGTQILIERGEKTYTPTGQEVK